jgi:transposase InsO family protein
MNIHSNARTCMRSRIALVQRVSATCSAEQVAAAFGVSARTVYKWRARHRQGGEAALCDRSSRPRRIPRRTPRAWTRLIIRLRRCRLNGPQIAKALRVPRSTVAAVLKRAGLARLRDFVPREKVRRYEYAAPGGLLHLDIKKLGRIARVGHRITGNRRDTVRGVGWEFVHVAIDDCSRLAYAEVLADERGHTIVGFLMRALAFFRRHGIIVRRVLTDNGSGYLSKLFGANCQRLRIRHLRTKPYTPQTNGKAERFIKTLLYEWGYVIAYPSSRFRTAALPRWLGYYNGHRPHAALKGQTPLARLNNVSGIHS